MKIKYMAALVAASVFGMATLTSCGPKAAEPDATGDAMSPSPDAMSPSPTPTP